MTLNQIKNTLAENTTKFENQFLKTWNQFSPHYTNLEPYQRGLVLIGLVVLLALIVYYLTHESQDKKLKQKLKTEQVLEEKLLKRMEILKKLRE